MDEFRFSQVQYHWIQYLLHCYVVATVCSTMNLLFVIFLLSIICWKIRDPPSLQGSDC
jgi:hypothetical protein